MKLYAQTCYFNCDLDLEKVSEYDEEMPQSHTTDCESA